MTDISSIAALCEAVIAVAGETVTVDALVAASGEGTTADEIRQALELVRQRHNAPGSGLVVEEVGGGWRLVTRAEYEGALRSYLGYRAKTRLSQAAVETLAIIAYRQPITLPEVNFLRGVNSGGVVRTLLERKLIAVAGRKQVVGTPLLYRTSKEFLVHFGLSDLAALPSVAETGEVGGEITSGA